MNKSKYLGSIVAVCLSLQVSVAQELWPQVTKEMKPWTRWWWLGSAVDKPNIERELKLFQEAGFGGVEITPIYGAKGYESRYVEFLSPKWLDILDFTVQKSNGLALGVDINLGTGWPYGGPHIKEQDAATKLVIDEFTLNKGKTLAFPLKISDSKQTHYHAQALRAFTNSGQEINLDNFIKNTNGIWTAPEDVKLIALFSARTRQKVKRAAPGGEGFTADHLGRAGVQAYFARFRKAFDTHSTKGIRSFFNDSYEVYGANWTDEFLLEFEKQKQYKLQDHLLDFAGSSGNAKKIARVKSDYREVLNNLLKNDFLVPFTEFSNQYVALSRNQAHGSPGNLIDLYASTDIAETETFGASSFAIPGLRRDSADVRNVDPDPMMFKFASSATNLTGKKYTSSETFTWLTEHFKTSLSQMKPEVEQLFLSGVNHVFYHGSTFSPQDVPYPGWLFYASVNFTTNNSFWSHLPALNQYITRVQSVLQSAKSDNELLVYWPIYDIWNQEKGLMTTLSVHHVDNWLHPTPFYKKSIELQNRGYSFDFISDEIIARASVKNNQIVSSKTGNPYKAIFVPTAQFFSDATLEELLRLADEGATVIFQSLPKEVPGLANQAQRQEKLNALLKSLGLDATKLHQYTAWGKGKIYVTNDVYSALETEKIYGEKFARLGLKFIRRQQDGRSFYYVVNHGKTTVDEYIRLNNEGENYSLLDPQTGKTFSLSADNHSVRIQLKPGYAWIILVSDKKENLKTYAYMEHVKEELRLDRSWKVNFMAGGPSLPKARVIEQLSSWTKWGDKAADKFAGTAAYETEFTIHKGQNMSYLLTLGKVAESAKVFVNGSEVGYVWSSPYELEIANALKNGKNTIRVEVSNLMANRIRDLDIQKFEWRNYHEINFVNIDYKNFDASKWALMDSGLIGPVQIWSY